MKLHGGDEIDITLSVTHEGTQYKFVYSVDNKSELDFIKSAKATIDGPPPDNLKTYEMPEIFSKIFYEADTKKIYGIQVDNIPEEKPKELETLLEAHPDKTAMALYEMLAYYWIIFNIGFVTRYGMTMTMSNLSDDNDLDIIFDSDIELTNEDDIDMS